MSTDWIIHYRKNEASEHINFPREQAESALERLRGMEASNIAFGVDLTWHPELWTITVRSDMNGNKLFVKIWSRHPVLSGYEPYADHNWYAPKLLGILRKIGCIVDVLEWDESP